MSKSIKVYWDCIIIMLLLFTSLIIRNIYGRMFIEGSFMFNCLLSCIMSLIIISFLFVKAFRFPIFLISLLFVLLSDSPCGSHVTFVFCRGHSLCLFSYVLPIVSILILIIFLLLSRRILLKVHFCIFFSVSFVGMEAIFAVIIFRLFFRFFIHYFFDLGRSIRVS